MSDTPRLPDHVAGPVLIVEDDAAIRALLLDVLRGEGLRVRAAPDGRADLEIAVRERPAAVVLDWQIPYLGGGGVADGLRAAYGDGLPILLVSADPHIAAHAARIGAVAFMPKPFEVGPLVSAVLAALAPP
jgi:DNA-binding response OmpR family regulator